MITVRRIVGVAAGTVAAVVVVAASVGTSHALDVSRLYDASAAGWRSASSQVPAAHKALDDGASSGKDLLSRDSRLRALAGGLVPGLADTAQATALNDVLGRVTYAIPTATALTAEPSNWLDLPGYAKATKANTATAATLTSAADSDAKTMGKVIVAVTGLREYWRATAGSAKDATAGLVADASADTVASAQKAAGVLISTDPLSDASMTAWQAWVDAVKAAQASAAEAAAAAKAAQDAADAAARNSGSTGGGSSKTPSTGKTPSKGTGGGNTGGSRNSGGGSTGGGRSTGGSSGGSGSNGGGGGAPAPTCAPPSGVVYIDNGGLQPGQYGMTTANCGGTVRIPAGSHYSLGGNNGGQYWTVNWYAN